MTLTFRLFFVLYCLYVTYQFNYMLHIYDTILLCIEPMIIGALTDPIVFNLLYTLFFIFFFCCPK